MIPGACPRGLVHLPLDNTTEDCELVAWLTVLEQLCADLEGIIAAEVWIEVPGYAYLPVSLQ